MAARLHVVAAVLRDRDGRVLLAQRPAGRDHAGLWEFPGGKVERDESPLAALAREIDEELAIDVRAATPLHRVPWQYGTRPLLLDAWCVDDWRGTPRGRDGQAVAWVAPDALHAYPMPAADVPIVAALRLARAVAITPDVDHGDDAFLAALDATLAAGVAQVVLRFPSLSGAARESRCRAAIARCRPHGAIVQVHDDVALARRLGADGVHLPARRLGGLAARPLPRPWRVGASCHDAHELARAQALDLDYAFLSPVHATRSHPDAVPLGWPRFAALVDDCALPVFALGGVGADDVAIARAHGAFGVAGISAFWRD